jgi:uncharacterized protein YggE
MDRTVTVVGSASVSVDPDCARLGCGVQLIGASAQDALGRVNEAMQMIVEAVTSSGVDRADIRTAGPNLFPVEQGYAGSNDLSVLLRDVGSVGEVIDAIAAVAGPNLTMRGVTFSVLDPAAHLSGARAAAMGAARSIATELAAASDAVVGEVLTIDESNGFRPPGAVVRTMAASAPTPVEPGSQQLRVDVTVTYRLIDAA